MTEEEYRRLFNLARTSSDIIAEIQPEIDNVKKTGKTFSEMSMEEKVDHIEFLNRMMRKIKIFKNSVALARQEHLMELSEAERAKDREYAKKYKPLPRPDAEPKRSSGERKAPQSPEDKLLEMLAKQLGSREAAENFIASQKGKK